MSLRGHTLIGKGFTLGMLAVGLYASSVLAGTPVTININPGAALLPPQFLGSVMDTALVSVAILRDDGLPTYTPIDAVQGITNTVKFDLVGQLADGGSILLVNNLTDSVMWSVDSSSVSISDPAFGNGVLALSNVTSNEVVNLGAIYDSDLSTSVPLQINFQSVPEPDASALLSLAIVALLGARVSIRSRK